MVFLLVYWYIGIYGILDWEIALNSKAWEDKNAIEGTQWRFCLGFFAYT
ncbi:hypothetical protein [Avibacterium sp. 21-594]|nr:hypothetical protein [Avibacterium sp. 21-594]MCW9715309.1 hypothetical protein [Avibacterium sp. 21-594]